MIHAPERLRPPASRLLETIVRRGIAPESRTLLVGLAEGFTAHDVETLARRHDVARTIVLGLLGTHRDARSPELRALWDLEEAARSTGLPTLALRFGPLIGPGSPLWARLASRPRLARPHRLVCPVAEEDAVETLVAALTDPRKRSGWYEVAGEPLRLDELVALAARTRAIDSGAWEPELAILEEQRLADPAPWIDDFGVAPAALDERVRRWVA